MYQSVDQMTSEQKDVLRILAEHVAKPGCRFLEVGSWMGDSTMVLANVAKEHGGFVFCVDWWKGNPGTEIGDIADNADVFSLFWNRVCEAGLKDTVIPIRGRSEIVSQVLSPKSLDFIFIDGDHRYENVLCDIKQYSSLAKNDGIVCGHDCEGYISDYDSEFLESGKNKDFHESVHCGVVCAVGAMFEKYSINNSIWSVKATESNDWEPTDLIFSGVKERRQEPPPPIAITDNYSIVRYQDKVYAVPIALGTSDITDDAVRSNPDVISSDNTSELVKTMNEEIITAGNSSELLIRLKSLEKTIAERTQRIDALEQRIGKGGAIEATLNERTQRIDALESTMIERTKRIGRLERQLGKNGEFAAMVETLNERTKRIGRLERQLVGKNGELAAIVETLNERTNRIETLEKIIATHTKWIKSAKK